MCIRDRLTIIVSTVPIREESNCSMMIGIKSLRRSVLLYKWVCFVVVFIVFVSAWPHLPDMLCQPCRQPCLFHTFLFSLHSIPFDDPLQSFREFCSYLIIFLSHNDFFSLSKSSLSGCDKARSKFWISRSRLAGCSGFSFIFTYRSRTDCGIFPWHIYSPMTVLLASIDCLTCPRIFSK